MSRAILADIADLPIEGFKHIGDKRIKPQGGGGSSQPTHTTSTVSQSSLPEYAKPYYTELLKQTGKNVFSTDSSGNVTGIKGYEPYTGQRVAGFSPLQQQVQQEASNIGTPSQFGAATQGAGIGGVMGYGAAQQGLNAAFGNTANYMSPYIQGALDPQIREAQLAGDLAQNRAMGSAIKGGTFGGSRQALMSSELARGTQQNISDILSRGYQSAFDAAQKQQQALGTLGMQGLQQGLSGAELMGKLGTSQQASDLERMKMQGAVGAEQQALAQKQADIDYQKAMEARDWEKSQLQFYSDLLRGNVGALGQRQVTYTPTPSPMQQLGGLGIAGLGAYLRA